MKELISIWIILTASFLKCFQAEILYNSLGMNELKNGTWIHNDFSLIFNHYVTKTLETPVHA